MLQGLPEFRPGDYITLPPTDLRPKTFAAVERAKLEFIRAMSETRDVEARQVAARVCFDAAYLVVAREHVGEFSVLHDPQPHEFAWNGNLPLFFHDRMLQACGLEGTLRAQVPIIALRALRVLPEYEETLKLFTDPIIETYEESGKAIRIRAKQEQHLEKLQIPGDHSPQGSVRLAAILEFLGGAEHITELEQLVRCEIADRCAQQPPELPGWLPSDVTEGDFKRCLRTIEHLPKEGLQFLSKVQAELSQLIKDGTPTDIVVSTLLGGYAKTFFCYASTEKDHLVMLAILEERVRAGVRTGGRISFGKAPELVVDLGLMTDADISAVEAELAVRIGGMERFIRSGASFDRYPKQGVFVESHSSTEIDIAAREQARAALRGYTEDTTDLIPDREYSEAAHLEAIQKAFEIFYECRAKDAIKQHGEHAFPELADPIARDVVLDLCRLRVLAIPYGLLRRTRASAGETGRPDDQTQSLMQRALNNALRGNPAMQIEVRKWAEPTLSRLVAKYRAPAVPVQVPLAEGDASDGGAHARSPASDDSSSISGEPPRIEDYFGTRRSALSDSKNESPYRFQIARRERRKAALGIVVQRISLERGLTPVDIVDASAGLDPKDEYRYRTGQNFPREKNEQLLAKGLGISVQELRKAIDLEEGENQPGK